MSNRTNQYGGFHMLLIFIVLGILVWVYGETDKIEGLPGNLMKVIMFIAVLAVTLLFIKDKEKK